MSELQILLIFWLLAFIDFGICQTSHNNYRNSYYHSLYSEWRAVRKERLKMLLLLSILILIEVKL